MREAELHSASTRKISLEDALGVAFGGGEAFGILYTPARCAVGRLHNGRVEPGEPIEAGDVFEAIWFDTDIELRWLRDPIPVEPVGSGAVISEMARRLPAVWTKLAVAECHALPTAHYLVWGRFSRPIGDGWIECAEERIRPIRIPLSSSTPATGARLGLRFIEYVMHDRYGNAYVGEERRLGFVVVPEERNVR